MNVWMHKRTGELAIARRIWLESDMPTPSEEYSIQMLVSESAWAYQNKYGITFILPISVQEEFEDLGEL